jgi:putative heme-binding domain-containing protein
MTEVSTKHLGGFGIVGSAVLALCLAFPAATAYAQTDSADVDTILSLLELVIDPDTGSVDSARQCLAVLSAKIQSRELAGKELEALQPRLDKLLSGILAGKRDDPLFFDAALLASSWKNPAALAAVGGVLRSAKETDERRLAAVNALAAAGDASLLSTVETVLGDAAASTPALRGAVLQALGRLDDPRVADVVLASYAKLEPELQPKAVELLTERATWSKALLDAIGKNRVPAAALNTNQVRKLLASKDAELVAAVKAKWGSIREDRDPKREQVIAEMRRLIRSKPGDPHRGQAIFNRVCGQCHKIYGEGADVGPDITSNGRASFDQLLSNVFDPSLVIGASYQAASVRTADGRTVTGLPVEDSGERVVLKVQGGKLETVARDEIDDMRISKLSMMPEGLETQIKPEEMQDLFAFLTLDRSPKDKNAKQLPGVREPEPARKTVPIAR